MDKRTGGQIFLDRYEELIEFYLDGKTNRALVMQAVMSRENCDVTEANDIINAILEYLKK